MGGEVRLWQGIMMRWQRLPGGPRVSSEYTSASLLDSVVPSRVSGRWTI